MSQKAKENDEKKEESKPEEKKEEAKPEEKKEENKEEKPAEKKEEKPAEKKEEKPAEKKAEKPVEKKEEKPVEKKEEVLAQKKVDAKPDASDFDITKTGAKVTKVSDAGNAIMITGATHARELLSMQVPLFLCLKFLHQAVVQNNHRYQQILRDQKFYFLPAINVDGAAVVEEHWLSEHKILNKRKNMNPNLNMCDVENSGVDLNRNYGVDWTSENVSNHTELCGDYWPG